MLIFPASLCELSMEFIPSGRCQGVFSVKQPLKGLRSAGVLAVQLQPSVICQRLTAQAMGRSSAEMSTSHGAGCAERPHLRADAELNILLMLN